MKMTRKTQLWILLGLSALAASGAYVIQGTVATGGNPKEIFGNYFWYTDYAFWGFRALVEAWVLAYLFQTTAKTKVQAAVLLFFEFALIAIIAFTLGAVIYMYARDHRIATTLTDTWLRIWSYSIASYTSLFMGGIGYAFRTQPVEADEKVVAKDDYELLQSENKQLVQRSIEFDQITQERDKAVLQLGDGRSELQSIQIELEKITKTTNGLQFQVKKLEIAKGQLEYELQTVDLSIRPIAIGRAIRATLNQYLNGDIDYSNLEIPRMIGELLETRKEAIVRGWNEDK